MTMLIVAETDSLLKMVFRETTTDAPLNLTDPMLGAKLSVKASCLKTGEETPLIDWPAENLYSLIGSPGTIVLPLGRFLGASMLGQVRLFFDFRFLSPIAAAGELSLKMSEDCMVVSSIEQYNACRANASLWPNVAPFEVPMIYSRQIAVPSLLLSPPPGADLADEFPPQTEEVMYP